MGLRAVTVCVDYADMLSLTLPRNKHHFDEVMIVTTERDKDTQKVINQQNVLGYVTNAFYDRGASFNKWAALEEALDRFGRKGWICLLDADTVWPREAKLPEMKVGELWGALRRMTHERDEVPDEKTWGCFPVHRNVAEWAGYTQVFHADDPHLGAPPWHETDWIHAGGADSIFQRKWPMNAKRRFAWDVLHVGNPGENWFGRCDPDKAEKMAAIWKRRHVIRSQGGTEADTFLPERIKPV